MGNDDMFIKLRTSGVKDSTLDLLKAHDIQSKDVLLGMTETDLKEIGLDDLVERKKVLAFITAELEQKKKESAAATITTISTPKSRWVALILLLLLGGFGAHRWYAHKNGSAAAQLILTIIGSLTAAFYIGLIPLAIVAIWLFVDLFLVLSGNLTKGIQDVKEVKLNHQGD